MLGFTIINGITYYHNSRHAFFHLQNTTANSDLVSLTIALQSITPSFIKILPNTIHLKSGVLAHVCPSCLLKLSLLVCFTSFILKISPAQLNLPAVITDISIKLGHLSTKPFPLFCCPYGHILYLCTLSLLSVYTLLNLRSSGL